jgi:hypothetical protein
MRVKVFMSYCHVDEMHLNKLVKHLAVLSDELIDVWHDRRIQVGAKLDTEIEKELAASDIVLLLVSAEFLASDYCAAETQRALTRLGEGSAVVLPVILKPCEWQKAPFGHLLVAPKDGRPIVKWKSREEGYLDVAKSVRQVAEGRRSASRIVSHDLASEVRDDKPGNPKWISLQPLDRSILSYLFQGRNETQPHVDGSVAVAALAATIADVRSSAKFLHENGLIRLHEYSGNKWFLSLLNDGLMLAWEAASPSDYAAAVSSVEGAIPAQPLTRLGAIAQAAKLPVWKTHAVLRNFEQQGYLTIDEAHPLDRSNVRGFTEELRRRIASNVK